MKPTSNTTNNTIKAIKRAARELHKDMPAGGRHGTKKGKRGYTRKPKHKKVKDERD
jgi:hypothetical protein